MSLTDAQASELLDEVLFYYHEHGDQNAEQAEPTLDRVVHTVAKQCGLLQFASADDLKMCAVLAFEQLLAR